MDPDMLKLLGQGGITLALLYLISRVGSRMVDAIDRVAGDVVSLDKREAERHATILAKVTEVDAKISSSPSIRLPRSGPFERGDIEDESSERTPTCVPPRRR